ncbi:MAG: FIST C-terminal domain-containing protein [Armatimonadetes bacterium]|nr:FIST C-terminal domain-containing protein [Armatimonadota bacterium]
MADSAPLEAWAMICKNGGTKKQSVSEAVEDLFSQIHQVDERCLLVFASPDFDLPDLARELTARFKVPVVGCTTSGEISPLGLTQNSISAVSLAGQFEFDIRSFDLNDTSSWQEQCDEVETLTRKHSAYKNAFGILLTDGLAKKEEHLASFLYEHIVNLPVVGGSAGDNFRYQCTQVLIDGQFRSSTAVLLTVWTDSQISVIKFDHFYPSGDLMVVTGADPAERILYELNGAPAGREYARCLGIQIEELRSDIWSQSPLVLNVSGSNYVRSIYKVNSDLSLSLFCSIEEGYLLSIGKKLPTLHTVEENLAAAASEVGNIQSLITFDCALRKLEYLANNELEDMNRILTHYNATGFSSYGEQYNALHVNQTFTGIAIGE